MQIFLDNFSMYGSHQDHLKQLELCFKRCREGGVSLNPEKCVIFVTLGKLLGHIVRRKGLLVDPDKVKIPEMPHPKNATEI